MRRVRAKALRREARAEAESMTKDKTTIPVMTRRIYKAKKRRRTW